jgi:adenosine deaminase
MPGTVEQAWIVALPKAEVHLHLEGCIDATVVREAATRHRAQPFGGTGLVEDTDGAPAVRIANLPQLLAYLDWSCALIDTADELADIAYRSAARAAPSGVRHIDVILNPTHWPSWQGRLGTMIDALDAGFRAAEMDNLATAALCLSVKRTQTRDEALDLVEWMLEQRHPRVVALSIDGDETNGSHNERFAEAFSRAGRGGLRRCAHAGESSGPDGVREAIDVLGAERIDHGVRAVTDRALVAELAHRSIPLDICPTSNVVLGIVPDLSRHPVDDLRRQGVRVSLNTDDPLLYGIDVSGEYAVCAHTFGWDQKDIAAMARTSIETCFADEDRRRELLRELDGFMSTQAS